MTSPDTSQIAALMAMPELALRYGDCEPTATELVAELKRHGSLELVELEVKDELHRYNGQDINNPKTMKNSNGRWAILHLENGEECLGRGITAYAAALDCMALLISTGRALPPTPKHLPDEAIEAEVDAGVDAFSTFLEGK